MKSRVLGLVIILCLFIFPCAIRAQVYNINFADVNFGGSGVTITNKVGNGTSVGDIVLYENVITTSGQQIDVIVHTQSLSNATFTTYDYTGTSQNNEQRWFSPQLNFGSGGGYVEFRFEFILGGTYNNSTNTGDAATLQNIQVNSYDIDGNGNANSNQYCDFGGFSTSELGNPTNLSYSYDPGTGLTRYRSTLNTNNSNALDEVNRVRCTYAYSTILDFKLGGGGTGAAYYFLDFGSQTTFNTAQQIEIPVIDLDTDTPGADHDTTFNGSAVAFTAGGSNITYTGATIDSLKIEFTSAEILDGSNERFIFNGSGGAHVDLTFTHGQSISNITIDGNTYSIRAFVVNGRSKLVFYQSGTLIPLADVEQLLDSIDYNNFSSQPTVAKRVFDVTVQAGEFESNIGQFNVDFDVSLPIELLDFSADINDQVTLKWSTASERNLDQFIIEVSEDLKEWEDWDQVFAVGNSTENQYYTYTHDFPNEGVIYYRLRCMDENGGSTRSSVISVFNSPEQPFLNLESSDQILLNLPHNWTGQIILYDITGQVHFSANFTQNDATVIPIELNDEKSKRYMFKSIDQHGQTKTFAFLR